MQSRRTHRDDDVAGGANAIRSEQLLGLHDTDAGGGEVVVTVSHDAGVLGGLATEESATGLDAALGDTADQFRDALGG